MTNPTNQREDKELCVDCDGTGIISWNVLRDSQGRLDYVNGKPTGEKMEEECKRCEGIGELT